MAEVAEIGVPDEKWGETIKALVVVREGATVTEAELIAHCRDRLAHFEAAASVEPRDALDRTATGQLQKYKSGPHQVWVFGESPGELVWQGWHELSCYQSATLCPVWRIV